MRVEQLTLVVSEAQLSPVMRQYAEAKRAYPDAILFFRMGDFYEMFYQDAEQGARVLGITLTSRGKSKDGVEVPMAGVPAHSASGYIQKLVDHGHRVAICEQMADPSQVKGIVPRQVVRVVTPALQLETEQTTSPRGQWLVALSLEGVEASLAAYECAQSRIELFETHDTYDLWSELARLNPAELLLLDDSKAGASLLQFENTLHKTFPKLVVRRQRHADGSTPEVSTLSKRSARVIETLKRYVSAAFPLQKDVPSYFDLNGVKVQSAERTMALDATVLRSLEIFETSDGSNAGSLFSSIDATQSVLGRRLLVQWLSRPLIDPEAIQERLDAIEWLVTQGEARASIRQQLGRVLDLERLISRACVGLGSARDLLSLRACLGSASEIRGILNGFEGIPTLCRLPDDLCDDVKAVLSDRLLEGPFAAGQTVDVFKDEAHPELPELRALCKDSKSVIAQMEYAERQRTGISNLKIRYSRVFGHTIEVTKSQLGLVPAEYRRKQTISQGERFVTDALEALQHKILHAEAQIQTLEASLLAELKSQVVHAHVRLRAISRALATLDVVAGLAEMAVQRSYVRPTVDGGLRMNLIGVRHPVIERLLPAGAFVENDIVLDAENRDAARTWIITGPNMAGKSTVMREAALAVVLAQCGAYVPARKAEIGCVDRMFTRVGAQDRLTRGESTFMVEMSETAAILTNATARSFVILDEIGRGTSTFDGLALAWSIVETLNNKIGCRLLCATHYHELAELSHPGIENRNVAIDASRGDIRFLYRLAEGAAQHSFGISVAKLAGLPHHVIERANEVLSELERHERPAPPQGASKTTDMHRQHPVLRRLKNTDINALRPIDAMVVLAELCEGIKESSYES